MQPDTVPDHSKRELGKMSKESMGTQPGDLLGDLEDSAERDVTTLAELGLDRPVKAYVY